VGTALFLTVPASVGLAVLGESMIGLIYQGGRFQQEDTHQTAVALLYYSVGLAGYSITKILAPAFYALGDGRTPMLISVASIAVNFGAALALVRWAGMGHAGLALSVSLVALFSAWALFELLRRRIGGLGGRRLASSAVRIVAAAAVMGAACKLLQMLLPSGPARLRQVADVALCLPAGVVVFYFAARVLRIPELEAVRAACYTSVRNAPRFEVGDPTARDR
jgi:putative peptidoglycan lipid II flippase